MPMAPCLRQPPSWQAPWLIRPLTASLPVSRPGATAIRVATTDEAPARAAQRAMVFVPSRSRCWKGLGRCGGVGFARIEVYAKSTSRFVHNVRKRGNALLGALMELLVTQDPGI
jgi:hypothetical protein